MLQLPSHLSNAIRRGDAVLILGAGTSRNGKNRAGKPIALGQELAAKFADAAGLQYNDEALDEVMDAVSDIIGKARFESIIESEFEGVQPSADLIDLFSFSWRRCYTFNIDDSIENIPNHKKIQKHKYYNALSERREGEKDFHICQVVHLNGCVTNKNANFILSRSDYARAAIDMRPWYQAAGEDYFNFTPIFIGTSLREPLLAAEIERAKKIGLGHAGAGYVITPESLTSIQAAGLKSQNLYHVCGTVEDFARSLVACFPDGLNPSTVQALLLAEQGIPLTEKIRSRLSDKNIESLRAFIPCDAVSVASRYRNLADDERKLIARKYYSGFGPSWDVIYSGVYCKLDAFLNIEHQFKEFMNSESQLFVITGEAGSGKSTCSRHVSLVFSSCNSDYNIYDLQLNGRSIIDCFDALCRWEVNIDRCLIFVDDLHIYADDIAEISKQAKFDGFKFISSARLSDWDARLYRQLGDIATVCPLPRFSPRDAPVIIKGITAHLPVPAFNRLSEKDKIRKLTRSNHQLLIAMKTATEQNEFNQIIESEFHRIQQEEAQWFFLIVALATLARCGISEATGHEIYVNQFPGASVQMVRSALSGIVEVAANGRLVD